MTRTRIPNARQGRAALLAGLLLLSTVAGSGLIGLASAQSFEKTVTGSPENVVLDTTTIEAGTTFTLEIEVSPAPGGGTDLIYRDDHTVADTNDRMHFGNFGAYENVTFRVSGVSSEPDIGSGSDFDQWTFSKTEAFLNSGGDRDYQCSIVSRLATVASDYQSTDCSYAMPGTRTSDPDESADLALDIWQTGQNMAADVDNHRAGINNDLQDAKTIALRKGYNEYVRALNNESSKSAALGAAKSAINDYYSRIEQEHITQWNILAEDASYQDSIDEQESSAADIYAQSSGSQWDINGTGSSTYTLLNQESVSVTSLGYIGSDGNTHYNSPLTSKDLLTARYLHVDHTGSSDYGTITVTDLANWNDDLSMIGNQASDAKAQMETLANGTYQEYQTGAINNTDLMDPWTLTAEYSPGSDHQQWAAAMLSEIGTGSPSDFDQTGYFNISTETNESFRGILFSDESPPSGQFEIGGTYDPSAIGGTQFVVGPNETHELTANFTIGDIRDTSGEQIQNVTIVEKNYETVGNVSELKSMYDQLLEDRAELDARYSAFGGGGGGFGDLGGSQGVVIVAGIALVAYGFSRE